jgi:class 3 adenylate cyclase
MMAQRPDLTVQTFLFADLSGFTALTEAHGDEQAVDLVDGFCVAVRRLLAEHQAQEVKSIGDALMLRTADTAAAIRLRLCIVHDVGSRHGFPLVRVGMHTGPAVERGRDWFGATVNPGGPRLGGRRWRGGAADCGHQRRGRPATGCGAAGARPLGVPQRR